MTTEAHNQPEQSYLEDDTSDDLEKTLLLAAQDADARHTELENEQLRSIKPQPILQHVNRDVNVLKMHLSPSPPQEEEQQPAARSDLKRPCYDHASVIATHYNRLEEKGLDERSKSRIVYMRNFHNWIKSMLINEYLTKIKDAKKQHNAPVRVMDMCCGKGGDLLKWRKANISHLICTDIAEISLEQCKSRYNDMLSRSHKERSSSSIYSIEYIPGDCSRVRLREKYRDPSMKLDLVSCQFAFHYSFESLPQAEAMLRNASECLQPGGYFIGTIPDANDLVARASRQNSNTFGNDVFKVVFECDAKKAPIFGAKYNFHLDGVVDCPEFLVHFPTLVKLARKFGLKFVKKEKFCEYFERMKGDGKQLLGNMRSLEEYPPHETATLLGTAADDYAHAEEFLKRQNDATLKIGTLSKSEWEASSIYMLFVFEKVKNTWNADGTPIYDI